MDLSVIIVNYNVKYFLQQCLASVASAFAGLEVEVFVVDNASNDGSCEMIRSRFPWVRLIENRENVGFAKANNQAIRQARGRYILLLNPDTVLEEETLERCVRYMDAHPEIGALGVKMIDGTGAYLPESKRGFPSPLTSFFKLSGLWALFPRSPLFNRYYMGHLSADASHEVDVLAGAFMMMPKRVLDEVGMLDEAFFMYGEDIDLSYRIQQAGYKIYYYADTHIIHYKGESTKRDSIRYVKVFYEAMAIFARKHFAPAKAQTFTILLHMAIGIKALLTVAKRVFRHFFFPVADWLLFYAATLVAKDFWASYYFHDPDYYQDTFRWFNAPLYASIWVLSIFLNGGYDSVYALRRLARGIIIGTLGIAVVYGFLDLSFRTSRAVIVLSTLLVTAIAFLFRFVAHLVQYRHLSVGRSRQKRLVIVGSDGEAAKAQRLLWQAGRGYNFLGVVTPDDRYDPKAHLGTQADLGAIVRIYNVDEVVFCAKDLPASVIIRWMGRLGVRVHFKIFSQDSVSILSSSSKNARSELYVEEVRYAIADRTQRRNKRLFDVGLAVLLLLLSPVLIWFERCKIGFLRAAAGVLAGRKTWVGYFDLAPQSGYPPLRPGVLPPIKDNGVPELSEETRQRLNFLYAKNYVVADDFEIVISHLFSLGCHRTQKTTP